MRKFKWQVPAIVLAALLVGWFGFEGGGKGEAGMVSAEAANAASASGGVSGVSGAAINTITVGAEGKVKVEPDVAYLSFAVETRGKTAQEAQQANADVFSAVEKVLYTTYAIDKKDVQTTGYNVQPEYNYTDKEGQVLKGYVADHNVRVTYRKLEDIGKLMDALSAAGANRMNGVTFDTEKRDQYELDALKNAMANAAAKAGVLASSANRQLGVVLNVVQGDADTVPVVQFGAMAKVAASADSSSASTSVQAGQIEVQAKVTVQYEMK
jgi:uncharacterized protein YggE